MKDSLNKNENCIKDCVMDKINSEHLKPKSIWYFKIQHTILWIPGILVTVLGVLAFAGILYSIAHSGWQYRQYTHKNIIVFLTQMIPVLWIISILIFGVIITKITRITQNGYKYKTGIIMTLSFASSIILGLFIFILDMKIKNNPLIRFQTENYQKNIWSEPQKGRLAGIVIFAEDFLVVEDFKGEQWIVDISEVYGDIDPLLKGQNIRLLGKKDDMNNFIACKVLPWDLSPVRPVKSLENKDFLYKKDNKLNSNRCNLLKVNNSFVKNERKTK